MKRLLENNINTAEEYDRIFFERKQKGVDKFDLRRWKKLIKPFKGGKLIDLGCLDSSVPILAKRKYRDTEAWGIDIASDAITSMNRKYPHIRYLVEDVYKTSFPSDYFDYAVAGEIVEHLENPGAFLKESFRILRAGGIFALSTPLKEQKGEVDGERHLWSFTKEDIRNMLSPYGEVDIKTMGSQFFPWYKYHHDVIIAYCRKI